MHPMVVMVFRYHTLSSVPPRPGSPEWANSTNRVDKLAIEKDITTASTVSRHCSASVTSRGARTASCASRLVMVPRRACLRAHIADSPQPIHARPHRVNSEHHKVLLRCGSGSYVVAVTDQLNAQERERYLFNCIAVPADRVRWSQSTVSTRCHGISSTRMKRRSWSTC